MKYIVIISYYGEDFNREFNGIGEIVLTCLYKYDKIIMLEFRKCDFRK